MTAVMTLSDEKILAHLADRVVLKPLTRWNEAYKEFPRYVLEYLCARYVDPGNPVAGQARIDRLLQEHYVESDAKELIKSRIKEKGEYVLLGSLAGAPGRRPRPLLGGSAGPGRQLRAHQREGARRVWRGLADRRRLGHDDHRVRRHAMRFGAASTPSSCASSSRSRSRGWTWTTTSPSDAVHRPTSGSTC